MMASAHDSVLALPRLGAGIPFEYRVPGDSGICAPLALALLESPALADEMFSLGPNALLADVFADLHERDLATRALGRWWADLRRRYPTQLFKWTMMVSELEDLPDSHRFAPDRPSGNHAWFCISRDENSDIPRVSLARAAGKLEMRLEGFGQTVIALLQDALRHLPECFTPWLAYRAAEWLHWSETENDQELIALARENGDDPADLLTREIFFERMPRWVVAPQRTLARSKIVRAAREGFEKDVIAACDAISSLASRPDFSVDSWESGTATSGYDSIEGMAVISWQEFDTPGDVIDDLLNHIGQGGDYVNFIDMQHVELTAKPIAEWMRRTEDMVHLAHLTERLILLIGDPF
ncbi:MAG TPA: PRTRC system protein F [Duganella sp.]|nr:PRTRC system protein F [Duganella sp.]